MSNKPRFHEIFEQQVQDALDPDRQRAVVDEITALQIRMRWYHYNRMEMPVRIHDFYDNTLVDLNRLDFELDGSVPQDIARLVMQGFFPNVPPEYENIGPRHGTLSITQGRPALGIS